MPEEEKKSSTLTKVIAFFLVLFCIFLAVYYWRPSFKRQNQAKSTNNYQNNFVDDPVVTASAVLADLSPSQVVENFSQNFFDSFFSDANPETAEKAFSLLSQSALESVSNIESSASALIFLTGVKTTPEIEKIIIKSVSQIENKATVEVLWQYSGGQTSKYFNLVYEDGNWKIDFVSK